MADESSNQSSDVVLLADDNDDDVVLFKRAYKAAGIEARLHVVGDGEETIKYLQGGGKFRDRGQYPLPRLLVVDLKMPRKSGFEVIQWVRDQLRFKDLRIVVLTTSGDLGDVKKAYDAGANTFIVKSVDTHEFLGELKEIKKHWL